MFFLQQVIPFLVLAVGVDNIFIFVHAYNRIPNKSYDSIERNIGKALGQVGPSILLCTASEIFCFAIGSLSEMPAVNTFAMYAAVAILLDFLFQITAFVALMCLDQKRFQVRRPLIDFEFLNLKYFICFRTIDWICFAVSHRNEKRVTQDTKGAYWRGLLAIIIHRLS